MRVEKLDFIPALLLLRIALLFIRGNFKSKISSWQHLKQDTLGKGVRKAKNLADVKVLSVMVFRDTEIGGGNIRFERLLNF